MDHFCFLCFVSAMLSCLCNAALRSSAGKGLTSWLSIVCDVFLCFCHFPTWCPGSGVVLDCIDPWSLPSFLIWVFKRIVSSTYLLVENYEKNIFNSHTLSEK